MLPDIYIRKTLRYNILEFLYEQRVKEVGLETPIRIRVRDMWFLLEYATGGTDSEKIKALANELLSLNSERFDGKPLIEILDTTILSYLSKAFKNDLFLNVVCSSENIKGYISKLKEQTKIAKRILEIVELEPLIGGGVKIVLGDKYMRVTKSKGDTFDLRVNIVKLMYGETVSFNGGKISLGKRYKRKDSIIWSDLLYPLGVIQDVDIGDMNDKDKAKYIRSVKNEITQLNKRSKEKFDRVLFESNDTDTGLKWSL